MELQWLKLSNKIWTPNFENKILRQNLLCDFYFCACKNQSFLFFLPRTPPLLFALTSPVLMENEWSLDKSRKEKKQTRKENMQSIFLWSLFLHPWIANWFSNKDVRSLVKKTYFEVLSSSILNKVVREALDINFLQFWNGFWISFLIIIFLLRDKFIVHFHWCHGIF